MTLARYIAELRTASKLSLRELAAKCRPRLDPTAIWKVENARPVKAKTLGQILRALGLRESEEAYVTAFSLWSTEQAKIPLPDPMMRKARNRDLEQLVAALRAIPEADWPHVLEALRQPARPHVKRVGAFAPTRSPFRAGGNVALSRSDQLFHPVELRLLPVELALLVFRETC